MDIVYMNIYHVRLQRAALHQPISTAVVATVAAIVAATPCIQRLI